MIIVGKRELASLDREYHLSQTTVAINDDRPNISSINTLR